MAADDPVRCAVDRDTSSACTGTATSVHLPNLTVPYIHIETRIHPLTNGVFNN